ncbi:hypothetical protein T492DRAFT_1040512 [Pavlovales sp. CCMP2436]|nr:hypothetical protein T492DRAFT_1040512 [Pavlovales sp. CCMP2436]
MTRALRVEPLGAWAPPELAAMDIVLAMVLIFVAQLAAIGLLRFALTPYSVPGNFLPEAKGNESKHLYEVWALKYSVFWIGCFALIIGFKLYETLGQDGYMFVCGGLALPLLLQPFFAPLGPRERAQPLTERYSFKANAWIFIFSHIGNYWYTHYFFTVLKACYTMPAYRLNDVPLALTFATHFYFTTYHTLSNLLIRKITTSYRPTAARAIFAGASVLAFSYFTAFMETLSISAYPDYSFEDRNVFKNSSLSNMAYTVGSAFYGIYFIVFFRLDESTAKHTLYQTCMEALGSGMLVLMLLDLVRLSLGIPFTMKGQLWTCTNCV